MNLFLSRVDYTQPFVEVVEKMITGRQETEIHQETGSWVLREDYDANSEAKNAPIHRLEPKKNRSRVSS